MSEKKEGNGALLLDKHTGKGLIINIDILPPIGTTICFEGVIDATEKTIISIDFQVIGYDYMLDIRALFTIP